MKTFLEITKEILNVDKYKLEETEKNKILVKDNEIEKMQITLEDNNHFSIVTLEEYISLDTKNNEEVEICKDYENKLSDWLKKDSYYRIRILNQMTQPRIFRQREYKDRILNLPIEHLELSVRAYNCLKNDGYTRAGDVARLSMEDIHSIDRIGQKSALEIQTKMKELGYPLKEKSNA